VGSGVSGVGADGIGRCLLTKLKYPSSVAAESLQLMSTPERQKYRTILYWRPLVPGLNGFEEHLDLVCRGLRARSARLQRPLRHPRAV
jgi:hypothetical protein